VRSPLCPMVYVLIVLSKLSQAIKHDIAEVKDDMRKGQKGKEMFHFSLLSQMLTLRRRQRDPECHKLDIPSEFSYQAE